MMSKNRLKQINPYTAGISSFCLELNVFTSKCRNVHRELAVGEEELADREKLLSSTQEWKTKRMTDEILTAAQNIRSNLEVADRTQTECIWSSF